MKATFLGAAQTVTGSCYIIEDENVRFAVDCGLHQGNKEIEKRSGLCTYIIETTSVKKYTNDSKTLYECNFMTVKNNGFAFGFSVTASFEVVGDSVKLISLRSQPLGVQTPADVTPYTEGSSGKEFIEYELVKEKAVPTKSEFETAKNKLQ